MVWLGSRLAWDAWIETGIDQMVDDYMASRLAWDAWIETTAEMDADARGWVASRMGRVDWNMCIDPKTKVYIVASRMGRVDWNKNQQRKDYKLLCRVSHGTRGLKL